MWPLIVVRFHLVTVTSLLTIYNKSFSSSISPFLCDHLLKVCPFTYGYYTLLWLIVMGSVWLRLIPFFFQEPPCSVLVLLHESLFFSPPPLPETVHNLLTQISYRFWTPGPSQLWIFIRFLFFSIIPFLPSVSSLSYDLPRSKGLFPYIEFSP